MTVKPEDVLAHPPIVLTGAQRAAYFTDGFLILPDYVPMAWLDRLQAVTGGVDGPKPARDAVGRRVRAGGRAFGEQSAAASRDEPAGPTPRMSGGSFAIRW